LRKSSFRTHTCGDLRAEHVGSKVTLAGWVRRARDLGGLLFVDLRDRYGQTQVVFEPGTDVFEKAKELGQQDVIQVKGIVRKRPEDQINRSLPTGEIEVLAESLVVLNESKTPAFPIEDEINVSEEVRLRWRFLDLRRPEMQKNLILRHRAAQATRNYLSSAGLVEIETPFLTKSTPEGARDFLVPSRIYPGKFYALPQSPQLYKQVLMSSGFDGYFQIARCFRDEDLRADRQPEFTQIDLEMSFADVDDVLDLTEGLMAHIFREVLGIEIERPFPRMTYSEAMERYGIDKPDTRYGMELFDLTDFFRDTDFRVVRSAIEDGGRVIGFRVDRELSRREIDDLTERAKELGAGGLLWLSSKEGQLRGPLAKFIDREKGLKLLGGEGKTALLLAGKKEKILEIGGALRIEVAKRFGLIPDGKWNFLWVLDFPLFVWNEEEKRIEPAHHMFSMPQDEFLDYLESEPLKVVGKIYDLVLNGVELGSGSIRVHRRDIQEKIMEIAGIPAEERQKRFGFLLEALEYGTPPHGGIALGFDRMVAMMAGRESIRDVIAFPKTTKGQALYEGAPSDVSEEQLRELHIRVEKQNSSS